MIGKQKQKNDNDYGDLLLDANIGKKKEKKKNKKNKELSITPPRSKLKC